MLSILISVLAAGQLSLPAAFWVIVLMPPITLTVLAAAAALTALAAGDDRSRRAQRVLEMLLDALHVSLRGRGFRR